MAYPIGIRLNNPGNIKKTHTEWKGMTRLQDHEKFIRFKEPYYGIRAMMKVILTYENKYGLDTLSSIIHRYAPPEDGNFTKSYIRDVSERTGYFPEEVIDIKNKDTLIRLTKAMIMREQGLAPIELPEAWYDEHFYEDAADNVLKEAKEKEDGSKQ